MDTNKTFCEVCRKDVKYKVKKAIITARLKSKEIEFVGEKAICVECSNEVYVPDVEDKNLKALRYTYLQKNKLL